MDATVVPERPPVAFESMKRLATPRWLLVHVLVAGLAVLMVNLGFWQLDRLETKREVNAAVAARGAAPVADLATVLAPGAGPDESLEWRRVTAAGTWVPDGAVTVLNRSADGVAGTHSIVPVLLGDDRILLVNRGFVPLTETVTTPRGAVTVAGYLRPSERRGPLGVVDSSDTTTTEFQRLDISLIARLLGADAVPMWVQLADQSPRTMSDWPAAIPLPEPDEGPHLSYAFQWFFFSLVAVAGWLVAVRRSLRAPDATGTVEREPTGPSTD